MNSCWTVCACLHACVCLPTSLADKHWVLCVFMCVFLSHGFTTCFIFMLCISCRYCEGLRLQPVKESKSLLSSLVVCVFVCVGQLSHSVFKLMNELCCVWHLLCVLIRLLRVHAQSCAKNVGQFRSGCLTPGLMPSPSVCAHMRVYVCVHACMSAYVRACVHAHKPC